MPTATIRPAMPGRDSVKPARLAEQQHQRVGRRAGHDQRGEHDQARGRGSRAGSRASPAAGRCAPAMRPAASWLPASDGPDGLDRRVVVEGDRQRAVLQAGGQAVSRSASVKSPLIWAWPLVIDAVHGRRGDHLAVEDDRELLLGAVQGARRCRRTSSVPSPSKSRLTDPVDLLSAGCRRSARVESVPSIMAAREEVLRRPSRRRR